MKRSNVRNGWKADMASYRTSMFNSCEAPTFGPYGHRELLRRATDELADLSNSVSHLPR